MFYTYAWTKYTSTVHFSSPQPLNAKIGDTSRCIHQYAPSIVKLTREMEHGHLDISYVCGLNSVISCIWTIQGSEDNGIISNDDSSVFVINFPPIHSVHGDARRWVGIENDVDSDFIVKNRGIRGIQWNWVIPWSLWGYLRSLDTYLMAAVRSITLILYIIPCACASTHCTHAHMHICTNMHTMKTLDTAMQPYIELSSSLVVAAAPILFSFCDFVVWLHVAG